MDLQGSGCGSLLAGVGTVWRVLGGMDFGEDTKIEDHIPVTLFTLRTPERDVAQLVITDNGKVKVYDLSFNQVKLLGAQAAQAVLHWPVEAPK